MSAVDHLPRDHAPAIDLVGLEANAVVGICQHHGYHRT
jgi:hypothetical protein